MYSPGVTEPHRRWSQTRQSRKARGMSWKTQNSEVSELSNLDSQSTIPNHGTYSPVQNFASSDPLLWLIARECSHRIIIRPRGREMTEMEEYIRTKLDVFLLLSGLWVELIMFRTPMLDTPPSLFLRPLLLQIHHILYYLHSTRTGRCTTPGQHSSHRRRNRSCLGNSAYLGKHASQQVSNKVLSREREPFFFSSFK